MEKENIKIIKYKRYISNSETEVNGNVEILKEEFNKKQKIIMEAPTGAGKTNIILEIFKSMESDDNVINILATSNKQPAKQLKKKGITTIVGGVKTSDYIKKAGMGIKKNSFCYIYDKLDEVITFMSRFQEMGKIINLVVDEAHLIIGQYDFRHGCMDKVLNLAEQVNGVSIFMSGTTDTLKGFFNFDKEIIFKDDNYKSNVEELEIIVNSDMFANDITFYTNEILNCGKAFIRLNSKEDKENKEVIKIINQIKDNLEIKNKKVICLSADDKDNNQMYKDIIEKEKLCEGYDFYFITSVGDQAINITDFDINVIPIFIINSPFDMNTDNIIQFINRFRKDIPKAKILIPKTSLIDDIYKIKSLDKIFKEKEKETDKIIKSLINIQNDEIAPTILKKEIINKTLNSQEFNFIKYSDDGFTYNRLSLYKKAVDEYFRQYFYNHTELKKYLQNKLKNKVVLIYQQLCLLEQTKTVDNKKYYGEIFNEVKEKIISNQLEENFLEILENVLIENKTVFKAKTESETVNKLLKLETIAKSLKRGFELGIKINKMLEIISKSETQSELEAYINSVQIININKLFLKYRDIDKILNSDKEDFSNAYNVVVLNIHKYFLQKYFDVNTDKIKQEVISKDEIEKIAHDLKISKCEVRAYIKLIFVLNGNKNARKELKIRNLKTQIQIH